MLFRPFDIGKWFAVGFCAWLAGLIDQRGSSFNFGSGWREEDTEVFSGADDLIREHLVIILVVLGVCVVLVLALSIVLTWLSARGKFMLVHDVALDRDEVVYPWHEYRVEGNSLFLWFLGFWLVSMLVILVPVGIGVLIAWPSISSRTFDVSAILALVIGMGLLVPVCVVLGYITCFVNAFIVPIMYKHRLKSVEAWRRFMPLLQSHFWALVVYGLIVFGLTTAITMAVIAFGFLTCCCGFLILCIPYISTVILLPLLVFLRGYSLEFLRQFGEAYDVFPSPPAVPGHGEGVRLNM